MICDICGRKVLSVFTGTQNNNSGICLRCYDLVPEHIPLEQTRKFLERKSNGNNT